MNENPETDGERRTRLDALAAKIDRQIARDGRCGDVGERELSPAIVGIAYANTDKAKSNRMFEVALCRPGDRVQLIPEPRNQHDENAVAVFSERGGQLGYLSAERAPWIGGKIKAGEVFEAIFQAAGAGAAVIRVRFGGGSPTLPRQRRAAPSLIADDFMPDPDGPEWGA